MPRIEHRVSAYADIRHRTFPAEFIDGLCSPRDDSRCSHEPWCAVIWVHIGADSCGAQCVICGYIQDGEEVGDDHGFALLRITRTMRFVIPRLKPTVQTRKRVGIMRE